MKFSTALLGFFILAALTGCATGAASRNNAAAFNQSIGAIADESKGLTNTAKAILVCASEVEASSPKAASALRSHANAIDESAARLSTAATELAVRAQEYAAQAKAIEELKKRLRKAQEAARSAGRWIFYGGIALGILGIGASIYRGIHAFSLKAVGAAAGSFVVAGVSAGFLWYGNIIVIVLLAGIALAGVGLLAYLAVRWRTLLVKTAETFDAAEKTVGQGKILQDLKIEWNAAQKRAGINGVLASVRGKT